MADEINYAKLQFLMDLSIKARSRQAQYLQHLPEHKWEAGKIKYTLREVAKEMLAEMDEMEKIMESLDRP